MSRQPERARVQRLVVAAMSFSMRIRNRQGSTMVEVLVASIIGAVMAGGTVAAVVTAARMTRQSDSMASQEANGYAQHLLEELRNRVAADDTFFRCAPAAAWINGNSSTTPVDTMQSGCTGNMPQFLLPPNTSENSIQTRYPGTVRRCYRILPAQCDGVGPSTDCFRVNVQMCWGGGSCPC